MKNGDGKGYGGKGAGGKARRGTCYGGRGHGEKGKSKGKVSKGGIYEVDVMVGQWNDDRGSGERLTPNFGTEANTGYLRSLATLTPTNIVYRPHRRRRRQKCCCADRRIDQGVESEAEEYQAQEEVRRKVRFQLRGTFAHAAHGVECRRLSHSWRIFPRVLIYAARHSRSRRHCVCSWTKIANSPQLRSDVATR